MSTGSVRILVTALGGEGGGVLMNWIVDAARAAGLGVQATSVPGVAQRTGATSYYIEVSGTGPENLPDETFNLVPMPGRVDIVLASELVEAARAIEAGYVSPDRTTLVASLSRTYATAEKIPMTDGRYDVTAVEQAAQQMSQQAVLLDLQKLAEDCGTYISATLFGAVAASGRLPWSQAKSRDLLTRNGANPASLNGFDAAAAAAVAGLDVAGENLPAALGRDPVAVTAPNQPGSVGTKSATVETNSATPFDEIVRLGVERLTDYQDPEYAALYQRHIHDLQSVANSADKAQGQVLEEAARRLANWMSFEDIPRVADLKTRAARFDRIRQEGRVESGQLVRVRDYLKPRAEEIADMLPAEWGRRLMNRVRAGKALPFLGHGRRIPSNAAWGYWLLRLAAMMKRYRRASLRYQSEHRDINNWLADLKHSLLRDASFALALAELPRVRKGYSDTLQRGLAAYEIVTRDIVRPAIDSGREAEFADGLHHAIQSAFKDEQHIALKEHVVRFQPVSRRKSGADIDPTPGVVNVHQ